MSKLKIIGWAAMAVCALGYGGMAAILGLWRFADLDLSRTEAMLWAGGAGLIGEIGLWVGAGCLGLSLFKKRQALFNRIFRRGQATTPAQV
jgi:hypothetical protein